jgi:hypothetical protein
MINHYRIMVTKVQAAATVAALTLAPWVIQQEVEIIPL